MQNLRVILCVTVFGAFLVLPLSLPADVGPSFLSRARRGVPDNTCTNPILGEVVAFDPKTGLLNFKHHSSPHTVVVDANTALVSMTGQALTRDQIKVGVRVTVTAEKLEEGDVALRVAIHQPKPNHSPSS